MLIQINLKNKLKRFAENLTFSNLLQPELKDLLQKELSEKGNWEKEIFKLSVENNRMKNFLQLYKYSSYPEYVGADRVEKNILNKHGFPDYFKDADSFKDFFENYLSAPSENGSS